MSIAQAVQQSVDKIPAGQVFGYRRLDDYARSPDAVIKAISRLVQEKRLARLSKGKFYVPKKGLLGAVKPSDSELLRSVLYKNGRLRGYITGPSLFNKLGLTTQLPSTITLAMNSARQRKEFGTIKVKTLQTRAPIDESNVALLQYLDVLKDIKMISDADINEVLHIMRSKIADLSSSERDMLVYLALEYYSPQTRALLGLLLKSSSLKGSQELKASLNPTTIYKLKLDTKRWPQVDKWNIR
ncbi:MAG: hypothetical protein CL579_14305 [Alteromonadaceae bacterium]|nr:hypothetical protein [Alteromonadaceae bacterium]